VVNIDYAGQGSMPMAFPLSAERAVNISAAYFITLSGVVRRATFCLAMKSFPAVSSKTLKVILG
jgi:hypothetical protein